VGGEVAGFRLERELGRGRRAIVYEATQLSLDRRVALKLLPADDEGPSLGSSLEWPEHPHVVSLYAVGPWEGGQFVAMRLVRGSSLASLAAAGELDPATSLDLLTDVASALDAAHSEGVVHGAVAARNVLVDHDGRALLSDFGLAGGASTIGADRRAFASLMSELLGERLPALPDPASSSARELARVARAPFPELRRRSADELRVRRRRLWAVGAGVVGLAGVLTIVVALVGGGGNEPETAPPVAAGAVALGSELKPGAVESVDCGGQPPSGGSQACTLVQTRLPGRRLVPQKSGAVRSWAVRGARGQLALQVIRRVGNRYVATARTSYEQIPNEGVHVLPADLAVRAGDRVGVALTPGAAIGVRRRVTGAQTARWLGQLMLTSRSIELGAGTGFEHEILLRVDYVPGVRPTLAGELRGRAAARAPAGRELSARTVELRNGVRRVVVVKLANGIAVDLFAGDRRIARIPARDLSPEGHLLTFTATGGPFPLLRWRNPDGRALSHAYTVSENSLVMRG
jgi:Protein tyrosine and serine/threonine kinase